jgi:hypothetical protein
MAIEAPSARRVDRDRQYEFARSSRDLLRLVGGLILLLLGVILATIFSDALLGFETDLVRVVRGLPEGLAVIVFGTIPGALAAGRPRAGRLAGLASPVEAAGSAAPGQRGRLGPAGRGGPAHQQGAGAQPGDHPAGSVGDRHLHQPGLGERGRGGGDLHGRPAVADGSLPTVGDLGHRPHHAARDPGRHRPAAEPGGRGRLRVHRRLVGAAGAGASHAAAGAGSGRGGPAPHQHRRHRAPPGLGRRPGVPAVLRDHGRRRRRLRQGPRPRGAQQ